MIVMQHQFMLCSKCGKETTIECDRHGIPIRIGHEFWEDGELRYKCQQKDNIVKEPSHE